MKKILIFTPVWKRLELTKLCYKGIHRFRKALKANGIQSEVLIVGSEREHEKLAARNKFNYVYADNRYIGEKHNKGVIHALNNLEWNYLMQYSSDNFIKDEYATYIKQAIEDNILFFGTDKNIKLDSKTNKQFDVFSWNGKVVGAGRIIHRDLLQKTYLKFSYIWQQRKKKALDNDSSVNIYNATGVRCKSIIDRDYPALIIDVKSNTNINSFDGIYKNAIKKYQQPKITTFTDWTPELTLDSIKLID
jgi:hypothetical protein